MFYDVLDFELEKKLTVRFLVREFCDPSDSGFIFLEQLRLRETNVYSLSESEVNFFKAVCYFQEKYFRIMISRI